jgi:MFS family permease
MRNAGISAETLGLGLTLSTLVTVLAMSAGGQLARRFSNRAVLLVMLPAHGLFLFAYLAAQSPLWFFLAILPMGLCFGLTDLFMNAEAVALEHDLRRPVFMAFHGSVSAGVCVTAVLASYLSARFGPEVVGGLALAMFALSWAMVRRSVPPRPLAPGKAAHNSRLPDKRPLVLLGIAAGLIIAAETTALLWSANLLDELAPALAAIAGLGAAFYGLCNALMRFPGDRMRRALGEIPLLIGSLAVSIAGFLVLGMSGSFALSVTAFATAGFGLALLIPCIFGIAANLAPDNRAGALSFISLLTALPRVLAPVLFGLAAAELGTAFAFGLVALGLAAALGLVLAFRHGGYA